jgi:hypothetical protein
MRSSTAADETGFNPLGSLRFRASFIAIIPFKACGLNPDSAGRLFWLVNAVREALSIGATVP